MKMINGQRCQNFQSKIQYDFHQICTQVKVYYLFLSLCASASIMNEKTAKQRYKLRFSRYYGSHLGVNFIPGNNNYCLYIFSESKLPTLYKRSFPPITLQIICVSCLRGCLPLHQHLLIEFPSMLTALSFYRYR